MTIEADEPNEYGFAGGATAPEPEEEQEDELHAEAEAVAIPRDDLTAPISEALQGLGGDEDEER
ncbi:hypothetical protein [Luedemannella helvata]